MTQKLVRPGRPFYKAVYESGPCDVCKHEDAQHHESRGADYRPLVFHCDIEGCGCVIDKRKP